MPQIVYSDIISLIIDKIIRFLSLSGQDIIKEKNKKIEKLLFIRYNNFIDTLKIKFIFFFIISFIFLGSFWFYISCFCFIYKNTQVYLIKDTLISFGLSMISPFPFYTLSACFGISALRDKNKDKSYRYKFIIDLLNHYKNYFFLNFRILI